METAQSAIRNLGGHEVNGRHLRVDSTDSSTKANEARRKHCTACSFAAVSALVSKETCLTRHKHHLETVATVYKKNIPEMTLHISFTSMPLLIRVLLCRGR